MSSVGKVQSYGTAGCIFQISIAMLMVSYLKQSPIVTLLTFIGLFLVSFNNQRTLFLAF